jgi:folate-dependent phosphoribosylglycinamide formyltransferase PurN
MTITNAYYGFPNTGNIINHQTFYVHPATQEDLELLQNRVKELEHRLCVLFPNDELHEKYPALKEAYEAYLIVERLVNNE